MKVGLICAHGGHLTEMLELREAFTGHTVFYVTCYSERADVLAERERVYQLPDIGLSPARMLIATWQSWGILRRERPDALVSTGSELALPFFYFARLLHIPTIFVESVCRITSPSRTGRWIYPVTDVFLVQWESLLQVYGPKARYTGGLL